jgi:hypothetical protein
MAVVVAALAPVSLLIVLGFAKKQNSVNRARRAKGSATSRPDY